MSQTVHIGYWATRGLGQPIRLVLEYASIPYEETLYRAEVLSDGKVSYDSWLTNHKYKQGLDFPNLPYMKDGDLSITQTSAIILYLAEKAGIAGSTAALRAKANQLMSFSLEIRTPYVTVSYGSTQETFDSERDKIVESTIGPKLKQLSAFLDKNGGPYLLGEELTYADLLWADLLEQMCDFCPAAMDALPNLKAFQTRIEELPTVAAYRKSDRFIDRPYNNLSAYYK